MINKALHLLLLCTLASPLLLGCGTNGEEPPSGPIGEEPGVEEPDFRPNIVWYPVPEGTAVKGAVMVCPGGAFMFRSGNEGAPVAERLAELGWQSFVVNYCVRPYTMEEGSLDLARAIRYVRSHAEEYGIDPDNIASVGFSAGGILCGDEALHFDGLTDDTALDPDYRPDSLDQISADVRAIGMIYSFYGRLSVSNNNVDELRAGNIPPTFYTYGTEDPFYRQFNQNVEAARQTGVLVVSHVLEGWPHGFGVRGEWTTWFDNFLTEVMTNGASDATNSNKGIRTYLSSHS